MGLFRVLFVFLIIYLIFKILFRYIIPILLGTYVQKKVHEMENSARNNRQSSSRREGEITIDYGDNRKKNLDKDSGEYVDFEEVN